MTFTKAVAAGAAAISLGLLGACHHSGMSARADSAAMMDAPAAQERTVMVGGAAMYPSRTIVENAANSRDHTTLVTAVQTAGLIDTLSGGGPFTVFAPTNAAFAKLPDGVVASLLEPANRETLTAILTYHVVPGRLTAADLLAQARANGGRATLTTAQGATLTVTPSANGVTLTDARGGASMVTIADVMQSNGVIHVIDTVLMPPA
jgi:uncharacterized surface protein with fasciclin (FAS1) repeats